MGWSFRHTVNALFTFIVCAILGVTNAMILKVLYDSRIEEELLRRVRGRLTFYSFTLRRIKPDTVASCFIVRTHRPVRWRDFIIRVALALEDLV